MSRVTEDIVANLGIEMRFLRERIVALEAACAKSIGPARSEALLTTLERRVAVIEAHERPSPEWWKRLEARVSILEGDLAVKQQPSAGGYVVSEQVADVALPEIAKSVEHLADTIRLLGELQELGVVVGTKAVKP